MLKLEDSLEKSTDCETGSPEFLEKDRRSLKMRQARLTMQANFFTQSRSNSQNSLNGSPKHCFSEKDSNGTPKSNALHRGARTSKHSRFSEDFTHATQNFEFQPEGRRGYNPSRFGNAVALAASTHDDSAPEEQLSTSINCLDLLTHPEVRKVSSCVPDSHFLYRDDNDNNNDNFDDQMDFPIISRTETLKSRFEGERLTELDDEEEEPADLLDRQNTGLSSEFIFLRNQDDDVENLKEELQITEQDFDIHFINGNFADYFTEGRVLGQGASGVVKKCTKVQDGEVYAVKNIRYRGDTERLLLIVKEFKNHRKLDHKNIIKVHELYVDYINKRIYTIMELVECKELLEVIKDLGNYSEAIASSIFKQIIVGINYLHIKGVCHRDIKPDNILVSKDGKIVKIADFNVSKFHDNDESKKYTALSKKNYKMWTQTGTLAFSAPEVHTDSEYTEAIDMWSSGVVLYTMLCGYQPFNSEDTQDLTEMIQKGKYEFHADPWDKISADAKDLIKHLLNVNPNTRYSPFQALTHPWIVTTKKLPNIRIARVIENIWKYLNRNSKKVVAVAKKNDSPKSAIKPSHDEVRLNIDFSEPPKALLSQAKALVKNPRTSYKITSNVSEPCNAKEFIELQKDLENSKTIFKAFLLKDENNKEKNKEAYLVNLFNQAIDKSHNTINLDENCIKNLEAHTPKDGILYNKFNFDLAALGMEDKSPAANVLAQTPKDEILQNGYDFGLKLLPLEDGLPAVILRKGGSAEPFNLRRNDFFEIQHEVKQLDCLLEDEDSFN